MAHCFPIDFKLSALPYYLTLSLLSLQPIMGWLAVNILLIWWYMWWHFSSKFCRNSNWMPWSSAAWRTGRAASARPERTFAEVRWPESVAIELSAERTTASHAAGPAADFNSTHWAQQRRRAQAASAWGALKSQAHFPSNKTLLIDKNVSCSLLHHRLPSPDSFKIETENLLSSFEFRWNLIILQLRISTSSL